MSGTSPSACGARGIACRQCPPELSCTPRGCDVPADTRWDFYLVDATIPPLNEAGDAWDAFGGLPDPYLDFYSYAFPEGGGISTFYADSASVSDTLAPHWGPALIGSDLPRDVLWAMQLRLYDDDVAVDDLIAFCGAGLSQNRPLEAASIVRGELQECRARNGAVIHWRIQRH